MGLGEAHYEMRWRGRRGFGARLMAISSARSAEGDGAMQLMDFAAGPRRPMGDHRRPRHSPTQDVVLRHPDQLCNSPLRGSAGGRRGRNTAAFSGRILMPCAFARHTIIDVAVGPAHWGRFLPLQDDDWQRGSPMHGRHHLRPVMT